MTRAAGGSAARASFQQWMMRFREALGIATPEQPTDAYRFKLAEGTGACIFLPFFARL